MKDRRNPHKGKILRRGEFYDAASGTIKRRADIPEPAVDSVTEIKVSLKNLSHLLLHMSRTSEAAAHLLRRESGLRATLFSIADIDDIKDLEDCIWHQSCVSLIPRLGGLDGSLRSTLIRNLYEEAQRGLSAPMLGDFENLSLHERWNDALLSHTGLLSEENYELLYRQYQAVKRRKAILMEAAKRRAAQVSAYEPWALVGAGGPGAPPPPKSLHTIVRDLETEGWEPPADSSRRFSIESSSTSDSEDEGKAPQHGGREDARYWARIRSRPNLGASGALASSAAADETPPAVASLVGPAGNRFGGMPPPVGLELSGFGADGEPEKLEEGATGMAAAEPETPMQKVLRELAEQKEKERQRRIRGKKSGTAAGAERDEGSAASGEYVERKYDTEEDLSGGTSGSYRGLRAPRRAPPPRPLDGGRAVRLDPLPDRHTQAATRLRPGSPPPWAMGHCNHRRRLPPLPQAPTPHTKAGSAASASGSN